MGIVPPFPKIDALPENSNRDLALDSVRAWSLIVVVFGHFIMQIYFWDNGLPQSGNTLSSGNLWPFTTWILQVMPLFFIAGGAVNFGSYLRSQGNFNQWLWQRTRRLMKPTVVFLLTLAIAFSIITLL
ncbi:MAG: acyltransferase family protein, partial [Candidatus Nanopelagicales bacterium]